MMLSKLRHYKKACIKLFLGVLVCFGFSYLAVANSSDGFTLTRQQEAKVQDANLTAVMAWHGSSPWVNSVTLGAKEEFERLGVEVLAVTEAHYDPAKQISDLETLAALTPDILLSLSIDSLSAKPSYLRLTKAGTQLVLLSNPIAGFIHGQDFAGLVGDNVDGMGRAAANLLAQAIDSQGKVGMIYHEADYHITNKRDEAFIGALEQYENIHLTVQKGFVKKSQTAQLTAAMLIQHPDLKAIYVSWDAAAEGVIESLRIANRKDIKVISHDLGTNNLLDMALHGNMYGAVSDRPHQIGTLMARIGAGAATGVSTPLYTQVNYNSVTFENIAESWRLAFKTPLPHILQSVLSHSHVATTDAGHGEEHDAH
ncbi:substrate-binding domain-containing protein [Pseudoalteromonas obscura]|uniref:Substrate-binding domain-containing protein n=1 Tax=Pseudoalteromonas obscura TaxID=3048491 RepID=A0ABT7EKU9_9GAMM|nr:substrate-binding domain-containing protein [Pseudoalteromonas sp. P94(2023)]MDK2595652.1 substrate-binding domain-containing protein [Pseudoalteromonas sp. P94(2023)]